MMLGLFLVMPGGPGVSGPGAGGPRWRGALCIAQRRPLAEVPLARRGCRRRFGEAATHTGVIEVIATVGIPTKEAIASGEEGVLAIGGGVEKIRIGLPVPTREQLAFAGETVIGIDIVVMTVAIGGRERFGGGIEETATVIGEGVGEMG
jgi:hypothetical protein